MDRVHLSSSDWEAEATTEAWLEGLQGRVVEPDRAE